MRRVSVVGIGAGDPDDLTVAAIKALNATDVFFVIEKPASATTWRVGAGTSSPATSGDPRIEPWP